MVIADDTVVSIHYTLRSSDKEVIDSSEGQDPLHYLHGAGNIIPGLESALAGKSTGEKLNVTIKSEDAYGAVDEELVFDLEKSQFGEAAPNLTPGMQFQATSPQGQAQVFTVKEVGEENVTVDANHPLAGMDLTFDVEVMEVRSATEEELSHGHVHGPGGHQH